MVISVIDMSNAIISTDSPQWRACLDHLVHDIYHLPEYTEADSIHETVFPVAGYVREDKFEWLLPLHLRPIPSRLNAPSNWHDATSPYGYPSPLLSEPHSTDHVSQFIKSLKQLCAEANIISLFIRLHPYLAFSDEVLAVLRTHGDLVYHGETVYVDLTQSWEDVWSQTRSNHRRSLRKLEKQQIRPVMNDWTYYDQFIEIYTASMKRLDASSHLHFPKEYFYKLASDFESHIHLCVAVSQDNEVASGGIFFEKSGIIQYHLGATAEAFTKLSPLKLVLNAMREYGVNSSNHIYHLGGGLGGRNDSLFHFKQGFSKTALNFHTYRLIIDREKYDYLCQQHQAIVPNSDDTSFFPYYRYAVND